MEDCGAIFGSTWRDVFPMHADLIGGVCRFWGWQHPVGIWVKAEGDVGIRVFPEMFF
jgi:hypothetical protein